MQNKIIKIINKIKNTMKDTGDPRNGAVFEKTVEIDFAAFCAFVLTQWGNVTMEVSTSLKNKSTCYLFYNGPKATDHIATYIINRGAKPHGVFGGTRIGSQNTAWNDTGKDLVENPFQFKGEK